MLHYLKISMPNRLAVMIVASLFILLSNSTFAEGDLESTDSTLPDFILEPAWDEDIPWSMYLGPNDGENRIAFSVTNIGGDLPEDCLENCSIRYWVDNGTENQHHWSYHFGSHINTTDGGKEKLRNLFEGNTTRWEVPNAWYGNHTVTACIDAGNDVEESNEDNNCWEGTFNFLPDLRWHQGNPEGTFESWLTARGDNGSLDPIEAENDFFIQSGKLRIETAYRSNYTSYGGNLVNWSVSIDGEEVEWHRMSGWGVDPWDNTTDIISNAHYIETSSVVRVCFDPENLIEETNEDNNCLEKTLVNETEDSEEESVKESSRLPAPSFIMTIGVLALATIASKSQHKTKNVSKK
tara:strand:+ start:234 stop:1286 length:1053 start_codon:yes stop_codon:yes gene_type:complete